MSDKAAVGCSVENNHSERGSRLLFEMEDYLDLGVADYINIFENIFEVELAAYIILNECTIVVSLAAHFS